MAAGCGVEEGSGPPSNAAAVSSAPAPGCDVCACGTLCEGGCAAAAGGGFGVSLPSAVVAACDIGAATIGAAGAVSPFSGDPCSGVAPAPAGVAAAAAVSPGVALVLCCSNGTKAAIALPAGGAEGNPASKISSGAAASSPMAPRNSFVKSGAADDTADVAAPDFGAGEIKSTMMFAADCMRPPELRQQARAKPMRVSKRRARKNPHKINACSVCTLA